MAPDLIDRIKRFRPEHLKVAIPVALVVVYLLVFVVFGSGGPSIAHYDAPPTSSTLGPPPPVADSSGIALPPVGGEPTTTIPTLAGRAHLLGAVIGPQGAVPGAIVRVERLVGDAVATVDLATGPDGRWDLPNVAGGRFRVRAFLPPTLAQVDPAIFFLPDGEERTVDLEMFQFSGVSALVAVAPDPPTLRQAVTLAVQLSVRSVDPTGVVHATPVVGRMVDLTATGSWLLKSQTPARTDEQGQATFGLECRAVGVNRIQAVMLAAGAEPAQSFELTMPECIDATATTSSSPPSSSSSGPGSSGSTSSTSSTSTTASTTSTTT